MNTQSVISVIFLSVRMGLIATLINLPISISLALIMSRKKIIGKRTVEGLINLPLVMPPVTTGYLLLILLGKRGIIGGFLFDNFGIRIAFTSNAVIIASMIVSFPLLYKSIKISIDMVDKKLENCAKTLGANRLEVLLRVTLPLIMPGVVNGMVLGFARSLGEFGATMTFAGNIEGITRTIPLAVYSKLQVPGKEKEA
ncbi:MAG: molybdate ABC transporter permease subunit, partial [Spirochaetales bacterium]|nr:molybdate ABC transporter permease subunit [Spirochaetales bacterium]